MAVGSVSSYSPMFNYQGWVDNANSRTEALSEQIGYDPAESTDKTSSSSSTSSTNKTSISHPPHKGSGIIRDNWREFWEGSEYHQNTLCKILKELIKI